MKDDHNGSHGRSGRPEGLRPAIPNDDPDLLAAFGAPRDSRKPLPKADRTPPDDAAPLRYAPEERALALGTRGQCLPTGLPTLDEATRGGPRVGSFGVLGGAPGAGKTTLLCQVALYRLEAGDHVVLLAADESPDGLLIRLGQLLGIDREALERGEPEARTTLARALRAYSPRLELLDVADGWTVEDAADALVMAAGEGPKFLGVDSIQTARALGTDTADGPRARADAVVHALKRAARLGVFVLTTSELARGAYRSNDPTQRTNSLASFKESGSVEYGVDFALVLRSVSGEADLVEVEVAKNRLGSKPEFRLRLDRTRALFSEEATLRADPVAEREAKLLRDRAALREAVLAAVRQSPPVRTKDAVCLRVPRDRGAVWRMLSALVGEGVVVVAGDVYRVAPNTVKGNTNS